MIDQGKQNLLGIQIDAVDYEAAVDKIVSAAKNQTPFGVSALAVHGVMTGVQDPIHGYRLNHLALVVPDGQPVRWALNLLYGLSLKERVYGPTLMLNVCARAAEEHLPIYLYGNQAEVLMRLSEKLKSKFPGLQIAGATPSQFRTLTVEEQKQVNDQILQSGASIVLVSLGCPRQEVWVYEQLQHLPMPTLAVGAAFNFHAGDLAQAPKELQDLGLEWLYRLLCEPRRLWKRYLFLNPQYIWLVLLQLLRLRTSPVMLEHPPTSEIRYG